MNLSGAKIYFEGVRVTPEYDDKIRQIVSTCQSLSPTSDVSMRFLKNGNLYEGLLWGKANDVPIGIYNRGQSMAKVLDTIYKNLKKQSLKVWKMKSAAPSIKKPHIQSHAPMAMAG